MTERIAPTDDCCVGEPAFGDPRGLHDQDCPVYQRNMDVLERLGGIEVSSINIPDAEFARIITTTLPAATAELDAATILATVGEMAQTIVRFPPRPARFECGDEVREQLATLVTYPTTGPPADRMWGVPVHVRDDMDPCAWRILDTDGQVLKEGTVRRP